LALQSHEKARDIQQKLTDGDPSITLYRRDLALTENGICTALIEKGNLTDALQSCQNALDVQLKLVAANSAVRLYQIEQATTYNNLGRLYAKQQHYKEAFAAVEKGLELRQKLANADPKNTQYANQLGCSYASRGWVHFRAGHLADAVSDIKKALKIWNKDKPMDNETRFELFRALAVLAERGANANSDVSVAEAAAFADQAVAALVELIKGGWAKPNELREAEFIALRGREDFRKLVSELVAKHPESPPTTIEPRRKD
jgi:tetratricopeptide (TPR) repeat protein